VRGLCFDATVSGFLAAKATARWWPGAMFGRLGTLKLNEVPEPELPGPEWVKLDVLGCGVCGTDLATATYRVSLGLEPFGSFPAVLGHEVVATVSACGESVRGFDVGQRVVVDPTISCTARGFPATEVCGSCGSLHAAACQRAADPGVSDPDGRPISPGLTIGYHRDLPGGFGERMVVHRSQLHPVADRIATRTAALFEPLSIAVHAVLGTAAHRREPVLVIGSGTIAMGVVWALRGCGYEGEIVAQVKRDHERRLALQLGADETVAPGAEARNALFTTGAASYKPIIGREVFSGGGFPLIFDCVGNRSSLDQALRFAAPRGRVAVVGCAATVPDLDLTWLWARELTVKGFVGYCLEEWRGRNLHTFDVTAELLRESPADVGELVTHTFPLADYRSAFETAGDHRRSGAVKVQIIP
jgi:threonine dehydrogenase-like Zn-dependent dehydrogenase